MKVRRGKIEDLDEIMRIYRTAKNYMVDHGNHRQWIGGYPSRELIAADIRSGYCFVLYEGEKERQQLFGVFAFILGEDPTYRDIEGSWLNSEPYGTIHRIGSDGRRKGVFDCAVDFCQSRTDNLRIDTHHDNQTMQHLIEKRGSKSAA